VVAAALDWLGAAPPRFFLWVHFYDPHAAYEPPPGFASAFAGAPYAGEIAFVDAELGRLLAALRERFGEQGLLLAITSDHGEALGEHGELTHSYGIYEATQRIPLLLAGPGLPAGRVVEEPVGLVDVAPTLLAMAGAAPLTGGAGRDLRELLAGAGAPRALFMETLATHLDFGWSALFGVRLGRWKYIRAPRPELFDLASDPGETRNLAAGEPARVAELEALLESRLARPARQPLAAALPSEERARLRSLGYVVPERDPAPGALGALEGPDPKDGMSLLAELGLAQAALHEGRSAEALARLDALPEAPPSVVAHRAAAALAAGEPARAERDARELLAAEPSRTDMRILLARALSAQGRDEEAWRALAALPSDVAPAPWVALAAARGELLAGQPAAALARLASARGRHPQDRDLARAQAGLLEEAGRLEEALEVREAALALAPADPALRNEVAWSLALLGRDLERALALVRGALEQRAADPELLDTLATVLLARGEQQEALSIVESALPAAEGATRAHLLRLRAEALGQGPADGAPGS
jgi:tetratricopeptide (TPR) repeat protein